MLLSSADRGENLSPAVTTVQSDGKRSSIGSARAADRRRRRHGTADLGCRAAAPLPGGGEPARAGHGRLAAPQLHQRRRRADRDEHVRREPPEARRALPRGRPRRDQRGGGQARPRRAPGLRPRGLHRRLDRPARGERGDVARGPCSAFAEQAAPPRRSRRRPVHGRDVLRPGRAGDRDRRGPLRLGPADRRDDDLRRGRRDDRRRRRSRGGRSSGAAWASRRSGRTTAPGRRRRSTPSRRCRRRDLPLAAMPNIGLASMSGGRVDLPARGARVLRRVRRPCAGARRDGDRRLLRHDADRDRRDPGRARRAARAPRAARGRRARAGGGGRARGASRPASPPTSARAGSSPRSRSIRRSGPTTRACSRSRPRSATPGSAPTWTSTTTRPPGSG